MINFLLGMLACHAHFIVTLCISRLAWPAVQCFCAAAHCQSAYLWLQSALTSTAISSFQYFAAVAHCLSTDTLAAAICVHTTSNQLPQVFCCWCTLPVSRYPSSCDLRPHHQQSAHSSTLSSTMSFLNTLITEAHLCQSLTFTGKVGHGGSVLLPHRCKHHITDAPEVQQPSHVVLHEGQVRDSQVRYMKVKYGTVKYGTRTVRFCDQMSSSRASLWKLAWGDCGNIWRSYIRPSWR